LLKLLSKTDSKVINQSISKQLVGGLIYLATTRPNLSYVLSFISRFTTVPNIEHWIATKRVLRSVKGTLEFDILYSKNKDLRLCGYRDSNWVGCVDDRKSTFGYVFNLGMGAIPWTSKK
jgi:hypothetical protein